MESRLLDSVLEVPLLQLLLIKYKQSNPTVLWVICTVIAALFIVFLSFSKSQGLSSIPIVDLGIRNPQKRKAEYTNAPRRILQTGYDQFRNLIFGVDTVEGIKVILPRQYLDELKSSPALSVGESLNSDLQLPYTGLGAVPIPAINIIKGTLNPNLANLTPVLLGAILEKLETEVPECREWTRVQIYPILLTTVAVATSRIFMGTEVSRNPMWIEFATDYALGAVAYAHALRRWPLWLRPVVYRFLPEYAPVKQLLNRGRSILQAEITKKEAFSAHNVSKSSEVTFLDWLLEKVPANISRNLDQQLRIQVALSVAAIHTTCASTTQALFDLAVRPEYVELLRKEVEDVLAANGGTYTKASIAQMKKLDSFMKESQRLNAPDLTSFQRTVIKPLKLSNGLRISAGTRLEMPTFAIHGDDEIYHNAQSFDGLRFFNSREKSTENAHKNQFVSVSQDSLSFGFGRHACPGRFMADIEIKILLGEFVRTFDIKNPPGEPRHPNLEFENQVSPDPSKEIMLKHRESDHQLETKYRLANPTVCV